MFKRIRPFRCSLVQDEEIIENMTIYKLVPENPELDKYWIYPDHEKNDPEMTDEAQEAINRVLCSLHLETQDISTNLMLFWYIPKDVSPDVHRPQMNNDLFRYGPITSLRTINRIRATWLLYGNE